MACSDGYDGYMRYFRVIVSYSFQIQECLHVARFHSCVGCLSMCVGVRFCVCVGVCVYDVNVFLRVWSVWRLCDFICGGVNTCTCECVFTCGGVHFAYTL
jgi:hypothetical protein